MQSGKDSWLSFSFWPPDHYQMQVLAPAEEGHHLGLPRPAHQHLRWNNYRRRHDLSLLPQTASLIEQSRIEVVIVRGIMTHLGTLKTRTKVLFNTLWTKAVSSLKLLDRSTLHARRLFNGTTYQSNEHEIKHPVLFLLDPSEQCPTTTFYLQ